MAEPRLTVAVTGPTGELGRAFLRALDRRRDVGRVLGMARRPFDPRRLGLRKTEYRQGDVLDRAAVDGLAAEADVLVHLAFIILGGRDETRRVNLTGSRNVFAAAAATPRVAATSALATSSWWTSWNGTPGSGSTGGTARRSGPGTRARGSWRISISASGPATMHGRRTYASVCEPASSSSSASSSSAFSAE